MWPAAKLKRFRALLLAWFTGQKRDLPWRRTKDPYAIWVSEIMLQQTRVAAAIPYFQRFMERFPTYQALAVAHEEEVLRHWAGLGYYSRARNLRKAALFLQTAGNFPRTHAALLQLPGVGDYTAAAVASIAFDLPHAVVDGNVKRVISRLFTANTAIEKFAAHLLDRRHPGDYNQALMELGATLCLPANPLCLLCPVASMCQARASGLQQEFPLRKVKPKNLPMERTLFWIERGGHVLAWQRPAESRLMPGFWELPEEAHLPGAVFLEEIGAFRHGITVHRYRLKVASAAPPADLKDCRWLEISALTRLPLSTIFSKACKIIVNRQEPLRVLSAFVGNY